ncbi:hypothetical protein ACT4XR_20360 (plasmid) [Acinetobacter baumannii]|uniref:hypothetical protein n=1 Tax=Acinetobacter baumannii TaxID=470 RepID=UPI0038923DBC
MNFHGNSLSQIQDKIQNLIFESDKEESFLGETIHFYQFWIELLFFLNQKNEVEIDMSKIQSSEDLQDLAELAYGHLYTSFMEKYGDDYYQTVKPLREYLDSLPAFNPEDPNSYESTATKEQHAKIICKFSSTGLKQ